MQKRFSTFSALFLLKRGQKWMKRVIKVRALTLDGRRKVEMTWGRTPPRSRLPQRAVSVRQSQEESINGRLSDRMGKSRCTSFYRRASALLFIPYRPWLQ